METSHIQVPISIVIPTYFEEKLLPRLLESIKRQIAQPLEVIVSDAFSTDRTREIAESFGAKIVDGGKIAVGRNNGAFASKGEIILFLDADTVLPNPWTLLDMYVQFMKTEADIASVFYRPDKKIGFASSELTPYVIFNGINATKHLQSALKNVVFAELGICILVKRDVFHHVGGFDTEFIVAEDKQFFLETVKKGYKYIVLDVSVVTSTRRYESLTKTVKMSFGLFGAFIMGVLGYKATSPLRKRFWGMYGNLGGKKEDK